MNLPKVSVIIPNYNYGKYIRKTVDSVLAQTYPNVEIIVVDDGSKDDSLDVLKGYDGKIRVIEQQNQGVSRARNYGVENSQGDYIAFLDADDLWLPEKIERQMVKLKADSEVGLVHCQMKFIDTEDQPCGQNESGMEGWVAEEFLLFEQGVVVGAGSTSLMPRRIFNEIGGFDPRQSTAADWDLGYRVAAKYKIGYVPEELVLYRLHGSNMHGNIRAMEHDMLLGYEKAFANGASADRDECYGNLHKTLAGSYFHAGKYADFARHTLKSLWYRPANIGYFATFPLRRLGRLELGEKNGGK